MTPVALDTNIVVCFLLTLLVPCAAAGIALINTGLGRSRNAAHAMLSSLCVIAVAALVYFVIGYSLQGFRTEGALGFEVNGKPWNWIGWGNFFLRGLEFERPEISVPLLFSIFSVATAAIIPLGSGADRWRLGAACASTAILAGWTYPLFAHLAWVDGWLQGLGSLYAIGRGFIDCGGAGVIQTVGGLTALSITWLLGPRRGKYTPGGMPTALPGHNAVFIIFGCFLAWIGWLGLNSAGSILYSRADVARAPLVAVNTTLAATAAALAVAVITRSRFGKTDASLCANGWVGGLVASSAGCAFLRPAGAVLIGLIAGALVLYSVEWLELHLTIDDPGGAISVHAVAGIWGLLATGFLARISEPGQWMAQLVGVATLIGFVLPLTYSLNWLLNRFYRFRVAAEGERQGLDLYELGAGAYPEFMTHNEDLWQR